MRNNQQQSTATTTTSYAWYGGAVQSRVSYAQSGQSVKTSDYSYNSQGTLRSVRIEDGRPRTITFDVDQGDQIVRRREADNNYAKGDPFELYYRFGGKQLGYSGNNGTLDVSDEASIRARTASPGTGAFRGGADYGGSYADFDQSGVEAINSYAQGSSGGVYTARAGDTLAGVALQLWGDASLWYKLAAANGLSASSSLSEGQALRLPSGVQRSSFTAATLNPYDPASAVGDTSPTAPSPAPKKNKCGIFGAILLAVVAVGIAIWAGPGAIAFFSNTLGFGAVAGAVAGGAAAAALGSVVSQGVGLATGIQDKFSWGDVALAALGGGIGGGLKAIGDVGKGLGKVGKFLGKGNFVSGAARGVVASSLTQGIGVATGLQAKFSWAGVAAAGLGGGISAKLGGHFTHGANNSFTFGERLLTNTASALANAATRSVIDGTDFGDNIIAALPDVIAQGVVDLASDTIATAVEQRRRLTEDARALVALDGPDAITPRRLAEARAALKAATKAAKAIDVTAPDAGDQFIALRDKLILSTVRTEAGRAELQRGFGLLFPAPADDPVLVALPAPFDQDLSEPPPLEVYVTGGRTPAAGVAYHPFVDRPSVEIGNFAFRVGNAANRAIDSIPGGRTALTIVDIGLTVAGGPVRALVGQAYGRAEEAIIDYSTQRFDAAGYGADAPAGGSGIPILASLAVGGVKAGLTTVRNVGSFIARARAGRAFDAARRGVHEFDQVYIQKSDGNGYTILDSYNRGGGEIISRKFTQFSDIKPETAFGYIDEIGRKYAPGSKIADVPSTRASGLAGDRLEGIKVLEIPVQTRPIPSAVIKRARSEKVIIRDINGKVYP